MKFHPVKLGCLLALGGVLSLTWINYISSERDTGVDILTLYKRLQAAEAAGEQVSRDLRGVVESLGNLSRSVDGGVRTSTAAAAAADRTRQEPAATPSQASVFRPNIYSFLPHLREHSTSLTPNVVLGQGRTGVSLVLGVPTVRRVRQSYLINTLASLLNNLNPAQCQDLLVIVFIAETDMAYVQSVAVNISKSFPEESRSGLLEVVSPSQYYYPNLTDLPETFGDSKERVRWRTKQNLDYSFLMLYAHNKGTYYVQLEDDIVATADYYETIKNYITQQASHHWVFLEFSQLGFIGKMFRTRDLQMIAEFFLMFHKDKPIDWLLDHILWVKVCNPEKDAKDCKQKKSLLKRRHKPSLFQHIGLHSSLSGKLQHLKDKDFGKQSHYRAWSNPPAEVSTSLAAYQQHTLNRAYHGHDFFWGVTPVTGDYAMFQFAQPTHVKSYLFRSGSSEAQLDRFYNTTVEVLPSNALHRDLADGFLPHYKGSDNGFIIIGAFDNGVAQGNIDISMQPISALRLVVHSDSDVWVLLSEVSIQV